MHRSPRRTFTGLVNRHHRGLDDDSRSHDLCDLELVVVVPGFFREFLCLFHHCSDSRLPRIVYCRFAFLTQHLMDSPKGAFSHNQQSLFVCNFHLTPYLSCCIDQPFRKRWHRRRAPFAVVLGALTHSGTSHRFLFLCAIRFNNLRNLRSSLSNSHMMSVISQPVRSSPSLTQSR